MSAELESDLKIIEKKRREELEKLSKDSQDLEAKMDSDSKLDNEENRKKLREMKQDIEDRMHNEIDGGRVAQDTVQKALNNPNVSAALTAAAIAAGPIGWGIAGTASLAALVVKGPTALKHMQRHKADVSDMEKEGEEIHNVLKKYAEKDPEIKELYEKLLATQLRFVKSHHAKTNIGKIKNLFYTGTQKSSEHDLRKQLEDIYAELQERYPAIKKDFDAIHAKNIKELEEHKEEHKETIEKEHKIEETHKEEMKANPPAPTPAAAPKINDPFAYNPNATGGKKKKKKNTKKKNMKKKKKITRRKKGGAAINTDSIISSIDDIKTQIDNLKKEVLSLKKEEDKDEVVEGTPEIIEKEEDKSEVVEEQGEKEEKDEVIEGNVTVINDEKEEEEEKKEEEEKISIDDQVIDVAGLGNKKIKDIKDLISGKIKQLNSPKHKGRFKDKASKIQNALHDIEQQTDGKTISELLNTKYKFLLTFKNGKLMGGKKTRKNKKNTKIIKFNKKNKTTRRKY